MYKIKIACESRKNPGSKESYIFNETIKNVKSLEEVKKYIINLYGKVPSKYIYIDTVNGPQIVGFTYSYWNRDISHDTKYWWQTDYIELLYYTENHITENEILSIMD